MDPARVGQCRAGHFRADVYRDDWDRLLKAFEGIAGCEVTRRRLGLGAQDSVTGWFNKNWQEDTIKGLFETRGNSRATTVAGSYVKLDAAFTTASGLDEGDELIHPNGDYYEVKAVEPHYFGKSFSHRVCHVSHVPLARLTYQQKSPSVEDARYRTKVYWETYLDSDNLNNHSYMVCYANPDYPLVKVFRYDAVDIIFAVDQPNSKPMPDPLTKVPYAYNEHVPTDVMSLDTELMHLGGAELRRITEDYPEGSVRNLETMRPESVQLGSGTLWKQRHVMDYRRGTT